MSDLEILHWFGSAYLIASMIASILVNVFPTPQEITARWYGIAYKTLERLSVHRPAWRIGNGNSTPKP